MDRMQWANPWLWVQSSLHGDQREAMITSTWQEGKRDTALRSDPAPSPLGTGGRDVPQSQESRSSVLTHMGPKATRFSQPPWLPIATCRSLHVVSLHIASVTFSKCAFHPPGHKAVVQQTRLTVC